MRKVKLGNDDYFKLIMGQSPSSETYNKEKIGLPFYQGKADFGELYPTPTVWCSKPKRIAINNDILLSVRAPVGSINLVNEKCCIGRGLSAIRCNENVFFKYLYWLMILFENEISKYGSGSTFDSITKDQVENIEIPLPETYEEQIAIAEKLDKQMMEIEKMRKTVLNQLNAIESLPASILRETFKEV